MAAEQDTTALQDAIQRRFDTLTPAQRRGVAAICDVIAPALTFVPDPRAVAVALTLRVLCKTVRR